MRKHDYKESIRAKKTIKLLPPPRLPPFPGHLEPPSPHSLRQVARDILVAHIVHRKAPIRDCPAMRDKCLPDIPPAYPASGNKALITITLAADAVNFSTRHCRRQFRCGATPASPGFARTVFAGLPNLRRINAVQPQPRITHLQRIAINRTRLALQQDGIDALGRDRRGSQAQNQQRESECSVWFTQFRTPDPVHNESQYRPQQLPGAYWPGGRDAFAMRRTTRNHRA